MKKLLIIDSNSILNRAFYGIRFLSTADGVQTNAIYGFLNILLKLIDEQNPDYICAAFDVKAPTFRHKMYSEYKAQRKPMPEGVVTQMPLARELIECMGIPVLELQGFEADDIIGTVSKICEDEKIACFIATGDKDDLQLASDKTNVILTVTSKGLTETVVYDDKKVFEKYGVTPKEFIDVKALMGDTSDNIPGVPGIGEKTAIKLIMDNHSIEEIYKDVENSGAKGAMLKKLIEGEKSAFLSKELATIDRNVPIDFKLSACEFSGFSDDEGKIYSFLKRLELNSIIKKLGLSAKKEEEAKEVIDYFSKMELCDDLSFLENQKTISVLLEFSGNSLVGASFSSGNKAVALKSGISLSEDELISIIKPVLEEESTEKLVYDIKEAIVKLHGKINIKNIKADVAIGAYLAEPSRTDYGISGVAYDFLGAVIEKDEESVQQFSLLDEETDTEFAKRAYIIKFLWENIEAKIKELGQEELYFDVELPLVEVLADMQIRGFCVDKEELKMFGNMLDIDIKRLTSEIYELSGEEFNINSPKQLGVILFEKLELPVIKKTKSGYSTNVEVLEKLYDKHPVISKIMEYRKLTKLKNTDCNSDRKNKLN